MRSLSSPQYRKILYFYCILTIIKHSIQHIPRSSHVFLPYNVLPPPKIGQLLLYGAHHYLVNDTVIVVQFKKFRGL